ncbi:MAG: hypothetical protein IJE24_02795 [Oscillospiraceae bacterium]|nr:hypothetical protein [Oscillospiraceae bacterium]
MKFKKQKPFSKNLLKTVAIYAGIFLTLAIIGLIIFWNYMDAYEKSQPKNVIDSYIFNLDDQHIQNHCSQLIDSINHDLQSEHECLDIISDAIRSGVSYARKLSECTDDKMVYMLMSDGKDIGQVVLTASGKGSFGFKNWQVTEESYDFSFLLSEAVTIDVPEHYKVYANGKPVGQRCVVQSDTPIDVLKDFYEDYDTLPHMVTYEIGPFLGDVEITITDAEDNPVTPEQAKDLAFILDNCSDAEKDTLDNLVRNYINSYVRFSTNAGGKLKENFQDVLFYVVPDSELAERLEDALGGLKWVNNQQAEILSTNTHYRTRLAGGLYLYDISYEVTVSHSGNTTTTTENVRLLLSQTVDGLKVERMLNY